MSRVAGPSRVAVGAAPAGQAGVAFLSSTPRPAAGRAVLRRAMGNSPPSPGIRGPSGGPVLCREGQLMPRGPVPNPQAGAWRSAWGPVVHSLEGPSVSQSAPLSSKALGRRTPIQAGLVPTAQPTPRGLRGQARGALPWGRGARGFREPRTLTFRGGVPQPPSGTALSGSGRGRWSASRGTTTSSAPPSTRGSCPWRMARWAP